MLVFLGVMTMSRRRKPSNDHSGLTACGMPEFFDPLDVVKGKVKTLVQMIRKSKYTVVYTGAGISTSAGIPDYRGPSGVWTRKAKGEKVEEPDFLKLRPTISHLAVAKLLQLGFIHHIVSQNIDGLHRRSGVPSADISELHGNYCLETCVKCKHEYFRPYAVWNGLTSSQASNAVAAARASRSKKLKSNSLLKQEAEGEEKTRRKKRLNDPMMPASNAKSKLNFDASKVKEENGDGIRSSDSIHKTCAAPGKENKNCGENNKGCENGVEVKSEEKPRGYQMNLRKRKEVIIEKKADNGKKIRPTNEPNAKKSNPESEFNHKTGRLCEKDDCKGDLVDSVILFGESLSEQTLETADRHSRNAELALVLGSSLRVGPACDFPTRVLRRRGKLIIVNLQKTPLDHRASLVIHSQCDVVMKLVMDEMGLLINNELKRKKRFDVNAADCDRNSSAGD